MGGPDRVGMQSNLPGGSGGMLPQDILFYVYALRSIPVHSETKLISLIGIWTHKIS